MDQWENTNKMPNSKIKAVECVDNPQWLLYGCEYEKFST